LKRPQYLLLLELLSSVGGDRHHWGMNDLDTVVRVLDALRRAGAACWIFGGWAEELRCLRSSSPHADIDLLYPADGFGAVERIVADHRLEEVRGKRFAHKRAFMFDGVMVELFLVRHDDRGFFTSFWGTRHDWPTDVFGWTKGLPVVSSAALAAFRRRHATLRAAALS
jgi:Aminoglycoside-2''-adenylyltransferase